MDFDEIKTYIFRGVALAIFSIAYAGLLAIIGYGALMSNMNFSAFGITTLVMWVASFIVYGWVITEIVRRVR